MDGFFLNLLGNELAATQRSIGKNKISAMILRSSTAACFAWIAFITIQSFSREVAAFAPPISISGTPELLHQTNSQQRCGGGSISRRLPFSHHHGRCNRRRQHQKSTTLHLGLEDIIFSAQNIGSSLANTVISPGSAAAGSASSLAILYTAGLWTSFSPCSLGLLPITVSYISNAAQERNDKKTILPTLAFAAGLVYKSMLNVPL